MCILMHFVQETSTSLFHLVSEKGLMHVHGKCGVWLHISSAFLAAGKTLSPRQWLSSGEVFFPLLRKCILSKYA